MNCPRKIISAAATVLLALPVSLLPQQNPSQQNPPQQNPPQQQSSPPQGGRQGTPGQTIRIPSSFVIVPVTVKDDNGQVVNNLGVDDFRLLEDNIEQKLTLNVAPYPLSAVIMVDAALKTKSQKEVQASLRAIAAGFGDSDEAAIFRFADNPYQLTDFISGSENLLTQLQRIQISTSEPMRPDYSSTTPTMPKVNGPGTPNMPPAMNIQVFGNGTKSVNDALYAAAQLLRTRPPERRRVIFLVSDGVDSKRNTYNFEITVRMLLSADAAVYSIGVGTPIADRPLNIIRKFARASGGDIFWASNARDLENLYPAIADQARNQYTLSYSPEHKERTVTYHSIDVRVRRPGLDVHARDGYYSAPPQ